jgi:hypothetical protein
MRLENQTTNTVQEFHLSLGKESTNWFIKGLGGGGGGGQAPDKLACMRRFMSTRRSTGLTCKRVTALVSGRSGLMGGRAQVLLTPSKNLRPVKKKIDPVSVHDSVKFLGICDFLVCNKHGKICRQRKSLTYKITLTHF